MWRILAISLTLVLSTTGVMAGDPVAECRAHLRDPAFDCTCVVGFLAPRLGADETSLITRAWGLSMERDPDNGRSFTHLYGTYGEDQVNRVLRRFHLIRLGLLLQCPHALPSIDYDG